MCVQETRGERRERDGRKTDGEMDREKANVAKWHQCIWLKGIWEFFTHTCEREKYMGVLPSFLQAEIFQNYKFKKFAF